MVCAGEAQSQARRQNRCLTQTGEADFVQRVVPGVAVTTSAQTPANLLHPPRRHASHEERKVIGKGTDRLPYLKFKGHFLAPCFKYTFQLGPLVQNNALVNHHPSGVHIQVETDVG